MDPFIEFLINTRKSIDQIEQYKSIHIVMGNESCDLDSMISALTLGYFLHKSVYNCDPEILVVPVLNIHFDDFVLRTENLYVLNKYLIDHNVLCFRNNIDFGQLTSNHNLRISIVDHHVFPPQDEYLYEYVVQVFDHRPKDANAKWSHSTTNINIQEVGSCSTLIADEIFKSDESVLNKTVAGLLYDAITFDTIGYKPQAGKAKELDFKMATKLEKISNFTKSRIETFDELWSAHNDVSHLTPKQLLKKDLKIVDGLPIPGLPMLVENYLKLPNVVPEMKAFCEQRNFSTLLLMGLHIEEGNDQNQVKRDLAVFTCDKSRSLSNIIINTLKNSEKSQQLNLQLQEVPQSIPNVTYFKQQNCKLTRKQILPVIKDAISMLNSNGN